MDPFVNRFVHSWCETIMMAALLKKANVLFAVNALSDGYFDNDTDRHAYAPK